MSPLNDGGMDPSLKPIKQKNNNPGSEYFSMGCTSQMSNHLNWFILSNGSDLSLSQMNECIILYLLLREEIHFYSFHR